MASITVRKGTTVYWKVSRNEYASQSGNEIITTDTSKEVTLIRNKYPSGTIVFESSTAGDTQVTLDYDQDYEIWLVGAGGGGAECRDNSDSTYKFGPASGGSGSYVNGIWSLTKGTYNITIGAGGAQAHAWIASAYAGDGGVSSFGDYITCGGGTGGQAIWNYNGYQGKAGQGGTVTTCTGYKQLLTSETGNTGSINTSWTSVEGGASLYEGYGKGGYATSANSGSGTEDGGVGYIKIVAV